MSVHRTLLQCRMQEWLGRSGQKMAVSRMCFVYCILLSVVIADNVNPRNTDNKFPDGFLFGAATAAYQIEGAWNISGKGKSIWDELTHNHPEWIADHTTGDVACDSYHYFKEDIKALKALKVDVYRFSISWPRILPNGDITHVNKHGINYYKQLIETLLSYDIQPVVTMYHWDLPQALQDLGGWANPILADYFEDYAFLLFDTFGKEVKWWITFNEPTSICCGYTGHGGAPGIVQPGVGDYLAAHTILQAHARVYHLYSERFRQQQRGKIGITLSSRWLEPLTHSPDDVEASRRAMQFELGWFAHPIFSSMGDYPPVMRQVVDRNSLDEGRTRSRLPKFSSSWVSYIRGTADFFALNHYTTRLVAAGESGHKPSWDRDAGVICSVDPSWPSAASSWLKVVPWGFRKLLQWIKTEYKNPQIFVTENGFSDHGELDDRNRISYYKGYLTELLKAINEDECKVIGYITWSVIDNFEWESGYTEKFGVFYVNFSKPSRSRQAKLSSHFLSEVFHLKEIPDYLGNYV